MKTEQTKTQRTPGPWKFHKGRGIDPRFHVQTEGGYQIAETPKNGVSCGHEAVNEANATFIVKACNAHDELVRVLREMVAWEPGMSTCANPYIVARALLARLEKE